MKNSLAERIRKTVMVKDKKQSIDNVSFRKTWHTWRNSYCVYLRNEYREHTLQLSDIPGDFVAINELLAQVKSVVVPLIVGDNNSDCRQYEEELRPPRLSRHRPPYSASPEDFQTRSGLSTRLRGYTHALRRTSSSLLWNPNMTERYERRYDLVFRTTWIL